MDDMQDLSGDWSDISESSNDHEESHSADPLQQESRRKTSRKTATRLADADPFGELSEKANVTRAAYETTDASDDGVDPASFSEAERRTNHESANSNGRKETVLPSEMAEQLRSIDDWIESDRILDAHAELSRLYWRHPDLRPVFQDRIDKTAS